MNKIIRFYNQNRLAFVFLICFCIFIIIVIQILNYFARMQRIENNNENDSIEESKYEEESESIISGTSVNSNKKDIYGELIETFLKFCTNNNYEKAYLLLSDDCKKIQYSTYDDFYNLYCKDKFKTKKIYDFKSWITGITDVYQIKIYNDILATGNADDNSYIVDYYTVIYENGSYKLNINNYIKSETFNKTFEQNGLNIKVENVDIYKDHYNYTIDIFNNTNNTILLDTRSKTGTIYISNNNNMKISASLYENLLDDLIIKKNEKKQIKIRFNAIYSNNTEIKNINFEDIIMEYEKYLNNENNYKEREVINIDLKSKE